MTEDSGQIILEETSDEDFKPTADELEACAKMLGIDLEKEPYLTKLVHECLTASLPEAWKACVDQQGNLYYFNFSTGDSSWEHPCDALYRRLAMEERRRLSSESGDPNGLATNPSEAGSSSEKETVTETSLHAVSNGTCLSLDNRTKEDSTGYHTASDDMCSAYETVYRETNRPAEESEIKSEVENTPDDGSRLRTVNLLENLDKTDNEIWTLEQTKSTATASYGQKEVIKPPDTTNFGSDHFLFEMNKSKEQPEWAWKTSAEEPYIFQNFEACSSTPFKDILCPYSIVDQVGEGKDFGKNRFKCDNIYSEENLMRGFNQSDELSQRIRTTIDHLLKNTHLSNSENAKIKELVNLFGERRKPATLKSEFTEKRTEERMVGMPIRQPYQTYTVPWRRTASDFPVSSIQTVKNRVRENEKNSVIPREGKPNSINRLRMATALSKEALKRKSNSSERDSYDPLAMHAIITRSEFLNSLDNEHSTDQFDINNKEERWKRDMGFSPSSSRASKIPGTSPVNTQHDKGDNSPQYHTINRLFSNYYLSPRSLTISQMQDSRDLEMRISNQRRWFQNFQRKVASRDSVF